VWRVTGDPPNRWNKENHKTIDRNQIGGETWAIEFVFSNFFDLFGDFLGKLPPRSVFTAMPDTKKPCCRSLDDCG